jgi:hypothetical protein
LLQILTCVLYYNDTPQNTESFLLICIRFLTVMTETILDHEVCGRKPLTKDTNNFTGAKFHLNPVISPDLRPGFIKINTAKIMHLLIYYKNLMNIIYFR